MEGYRRSNEVDGKLYQLSGSFSFSGLWTSAANVDEQGSMSLDSLLAQAPEDSCVIGGASVYKALLDKCDTAYITKIHKSYPADCWLPDLDADPHWTLAEESEPLEEDGLIFHYATYKRI